MKSIRAFFSIIILLITTASFAQPVTGKISGTLANAGAGVKMHFWIRTWIPYAQLIKYDTAVTDANGYYELNYSVTIDSTTGISVYFNDCNSNSVSDSLTINDTAYSVLNQVHNYNYCPGNSGHFSGTLLGASSGVKVYTDILDPSGPGGYLFRDSTYTNSSGNYYKTFTTTTAISSSSTAMVSFVDCDTIFQWDTIPMSATYNGLRPKINMLYCTSSCQAGFTSVGAGGNSIQFTSTSTPNTSGISYSWGFGDLSAGSPAKNPLHTYSSPGSYYVCLIMYDSTTTCTSQFCDTVVVTNSCVANFTTSKAGLQVSFGNSSSPSSGVNYYWDFGDGNSSSNKYPTHTYATGGTYTVCLKLYQTVGTVWVICDTICKSVTVTAPTNVSGTISGTLSNAPSAGVSVGIRITQWNPYSLLFTDTVTTNSSGYFTTAYSIPMNSTSGYGVEAYFIDCNTNYQKDSIPLYDTSAAARNPVFSFNYCPCTANANFTDSITGPTSRQFYNLSTPNHTSMSYIWDFGDLTTSTAKNPSHTYTTYGTYGVCLTVYDSLAACSDQYCDTISVSNTCNADFNWTNNGLNVSFNNTSTGNSGVYLWTFGDGDSTYTTNPTHTYSTNSNYTVCLTAYDSATSAICDQKCKSVNLNPPSPPYLSGNITTSGTTLSGEGIVYLIHADSNNFLSAVDSALVSDTINGYSFIIYNPGTYHVKAALLPSNSSYTSYLPTYYNNSLSWSTSTAITVGTSNVTGKNINLIQGLNPGGPAFIGGLVSLGANKTAGPGDPLKGVHVILTDDQDNAIAYDVTDANGEYSFDNLAYGTYKLFIDILNKNSAVRTIVLSPDNERVEDANFKVGEKEITTGIKKVSNVEVGGIFPNPASDYVKMSITAKSSAKAQLVITDILGKEVFTKTQSLVTGNQLVILNTSFLNEGIYFLNIISENGVQTEKFIKSQGN